MTMKSKIYESKPTKQKHSYELLELLVSTLCTLELKELPCSSIEKLISKKSSFCRSNIGMFF